MDALAAQRVEIKRAANLLLRQIDSEEERLNDLYGERRATDDTNPLYAAVILLRDKALESVGA